MRANGFSGQFMLLIFPSRSRNGEDRREEESMSRISREEEARLVAEFEREADDDEQWEEAPAPVQRGRGTLGTQVTIRLDPSMAEQLRRVAKDRDVGYTSLLRTWIEERLSSEMALLQPEQLRIAYAGESVESNAVHWSGEGEVKLSLLGAAGYFALSCHTTNLELRGGIKSDPREAATSGGLDQEM